MSISASLPGSFLICLEYYKHVSRCPVWGSCVTHMDTDNSMVITRGKGRWGEVKEGKRKINGDGKRFDLGW